MALAVCLLFDADTEHALRRLWHRLENLDVPTLLTHTHRRHVPHVSYAVLRTFVVDEVADAVEQLPDGGPMVLHLDALGSFRRGRIWLAPAPTEDLLRRQHRVVEAVVATGADLHRNYRPGAWTPHCTLSPRTRLVDLPRLAAAIYDVLPVDAVVDAAALVDSTTGERLALRGIP
ncbi:2'-5' RNA ligase family protein [Rhodococcus zopfii]|uniref:2'-5' RNA ligase family protein n=1 Tax=Rhodococcus zopfii TaxID=43772 RepID=A0ABU3WQV5_9NOCA|nr:2'-5' RNA ligase family protein [Rhodococcus zopfii]MDV2476360.1 2'-5' RNA ligase family protein [Rhodococcus zopfii]